MDMLHGSIAKNVLLFSLPLAASSILQQLFNSADVAVVGRFAGSNALAAVGSNASMTALFVNIFVGLAVGANVVLANLIGQQKKQELEKVVHTIILFALLGGMFMLVLGQLLAHQIHQWIATPEEVQSLAVLYLRIYFLGMPFQVLYNFGAAILRSVGDTRRPMYCLFLSGTINVCLNLLLVIVFHLGVAGVAISTVTANAISAGMILYFLLHEEESIRLKPGRLRMDKKYLVRVLQVGAPASVQAAVFSLSNVCLQSGINSFGASAIAGSSTALNFEYFTYFMINSFAQAAVTFTSQNFGAGNMERCRKTFYICMTEGMLLTILMSLVFNIWGSFFAGLYTVDSVVIDYALIRMRHVMLLECLVGTYEISGSLLRGMGHSMLPAVITIFGSVVFRIIWLFTVFARWHSFQTLVNVYPVSWVLTGTVMLVVYYQVGVKRYFAGKRTLGM